MQGEDYCIYSSRVLWKFIINSEDRERSGDARAKRWRSEQVNLD